MIPWFGRVDAGISSRKAVRQHGGWSGRSTNDRAEAEDRVSSCGWDQTSWPFASQFSEERIWFAATPCSASRLLCRRSNRCGQSSVAVHCAAGNIRSLGVRFPFTDPWGHQSQILHKRGDARRIHTPLSDTNQFRRADSLITRRSRKPCPANRF